MTKKKLDLVQIIRDNPGCIAVIDNDCWWIHADEKARENDEILVSDSDDFKPLGDGGQPGHLYGGDILQALAQIVGVKVESV